tara:strand:+ start:396 stop:836 length:441 start_codon:yes stop_codon:yes gene_type:complete
MKTNLEKINNKIRQLLDSIKIDVFGYRSEKEQIEDESKGNKHPISLLREGTIDELLRYQKNYETLTFTGYLRQIEQLVRVTKTSENKEFNKLVLCVRGLYASIEIELNQLYEHIRKETREENDKILELEVKLERMTKKYEHLLKLS